MKRGMKPALPGEIIKEMIDVLREESGHHYSLSEMAKGIGVARKTISSILNGHQGISPQMAV